MPGRRIPVRVGEIVFPSKKDYENGMREAVRRLPLEQVAHCETLTRNLLEHHAQYEGLEILGIEAVRDHTLRQRRLGHLVGHHSPALKIEAADEPIWPLVHFIDERGEQCQDVPTLFPASRGPFEKRMRELVHIRYMPPRQPCMECGSPDSDLHHDNPTFRELCREIRSEFGDLWKHRKAGTPNTVDADLSESHPVRKRIAEVHCPTQVGQGIRWLCREHHLERHREMKAKT